MRTIKNAASSRTKIFGGTLLLVALLTLGSSRAVSDQRPKPETIQASVSGTSTQLGQLTNMTFIIYEFSTPEDKQILVDAFKKGQNQGLNNALSKMRAVGRIAVTGTLGYDVTYIRMFPTPTGRKIRFVTNRQIRFGEAWSDSRSQDYNLTGGEMDLNDSDMKKSTGVLYPAAKLMMKDNELTIDLLQNPWRLGNFIDYKGAPGEN
jgi:hypothetical protein